MRVIASAMANESQKKIDRFRFLRDDKLILDISHALDMTASFFQRRPIPPTTCLTKRKTWTQFFLGEGVPILLFVELIVEIVCIKTK